MNDHSFFNVNFHSHFNTYVSLKKEDILFYYFTVLIQTIYGIFFISVKSASLLDIEGKKTRQSTNFL